MMSALAGLIVIDTRAAGLTIKTVEPPMPSIVPLMVEDPRRWGRAGSRSP